MYVIFRTCGAWFRTCRAGLHTLRFGLHIFGGVQVGLHSFNAISDVFNQIPRTLTN